MEGAETYGLSQSILSTTSSQVVHQERNIFLLNLGTAGLL
jgi:hypothetical protein